MADRSGWGFHKGLSVALLARVGTLKKKQKRDCQCIVSLTSVKTNLLIFPECPTASTPLLQMAGVKGTEVPVWCSLPSFHTWPGDCEHPGAGWGNHVVHMRPHRCLHPWGQDALASLGPAAVGVPSTSLLELPVQNWKPNENPQKHFTLHCFQMFGEL